MPQIYIYILSILPSSIIETNLCQITIRIKPNTSNTLSSLLVFKECSMLFPFSCCLAAPSEPFLEQTFHPTMNQLLGDWLKPRAHRIQSLVAITCYNKRCFTTKKTWEYLRVFVVGFSQICIKNGRDYPHHHLLVSSPPFDHFSRFAWENFWGMPSLLPFLHRCGADRRLPSAIPAPSDGQ